MHKEACVASTRGTNLSFFSYRMLTFLRSMPFVLVPMVASWPLEGLTTSFTSGMLWEVGSLPCRPTLCFPSRPHPQLVSWWVKVVDRFMFPHVEYSYGQWPDGSLARVLSLLF